MKRFFIKEGEDPAKEVTKKTWVRTERNAGFHQTKGFSADEPATGAFDSAINSKSVKGIIIDTAGKIAECDPEIAILLQHPPFLSEE